MSVAVRLIQLCLLTLMVMQVAQAANVLTCADATQVGKPPWPTSGACTSTSYRVAGPGLIVAAASADAAGAWGTPAWKTAATLVPTDHVFTDIKDATGSAWALASAFMWVAAPPATGAITLMWIPPTTTWDDKPFTAGIVGYQVYSAASGSPLTAHGVPLGPVTSYVLTGLAAGSYDFAVTVLTSEGIESAQSNIVTHAPVFAKQVPKAPVLK